jgi:DNA polymerase-3 subunit delta'
MTELAHPREAFHLQGHDGPEAAFLQALQRGRLHHAWLLTGPEGVGKATFAYRAARRLLGAPPGPQHGPLGADMEHTVTRQVAARSHPDLMVIERVGDDGKPRRLIPVEEARKLPEFFSKSPGEADYRVAIIDAVDDLNNQGANAVLKTLEEPPERGVLFLVSHSPGALLPTIRSRCRRLVFRAPPEEASGPLVARLGDLNLEEALRLLRMAQGAPGKALRLGEAGALALDDAARQIVQTLPRLDYPTLQPLADSFRGNEGMERFRILVQRLAARLHDRAIERARDGVAAVGVAEAWSELQQLPDRVDGLNLDRAEALWSALGDLKRVA